MFCLSCFYVYEQLCLFFSRWSSIFFSQIDVICIVKIHYKYVRLIDEMYFYKFFQTVLSLRSHTFSKRLHSYIRLQASNFIKKRLQDSVFLESLQIFKNIFFYRTPPVNASVQFNSWSWNIKYWNNSKTFCLPDNFELLKLSKVF